jgi:hypothetical protein
VDWHWANNQKASSRRQRLPVKHNRRVHNSPALTLDLNPQYSCGWLATSIR